MNRNFFTVIVTRWVFFASLAFGFVPSFAQPPAARAYIDTLLRFRQQYIDSHEVVKGADRTLLRFFPVDPSYRIQARFEPAAQVPWITMKTSSGKTQTYRRFGKIQFQMDGRTCTLTLYQSQDLLQSPQYIDYLFLPFTDSTSGTQSYGGGRYLDFKQSDLHDGVLEVDFNKAYNPYCAYVSGYSCPIPPKENDLPVPVRAGEMSFAKTKTH